MITIEQLRTPLTEEEAYDEIIGDLKDLGFTADDWEPGSVVRTIVEVAARRVALESTWPGLISMQMFLQDANDAGLTSLVSSSYDLERQAAVPTQGQIFLSASAGVGPYTFAAGQLVVADDTFGYQYRNIAGGTLNVGSSSYVAFEADVSGSLRNVANNTITTFVQALAGVSVNNPPDPETGTWITQAGTDEESDAKLKARARSRWGTLPYATPAAGFENVVLSVPAIAKSRIDATNPRGSGSLDVYVWGSGSHPGASAISTAQDLCTARKHATERVLVVAATEQTQAVSASVTYDSSTSEAAMLSAVSASLVSYFDGLPIGGKEVSGQGYAFKSELIAAVMGVDGVINTSMSVPSDDVLVDPFEVVTLGTLSLTPVKAT